MISLDSIFENIIAELIIIVTSLLISVFLPKIISKVKSDSGNISEIILTIQDVYMISTGLRNIQKTSWLEV